MYGSHTVPLSICGYFAVVTSLTVIANLNSDYVLFFNTILITSDVCLDILEMALL